MVKELRLAGVSSIAAANAWLPGFITAYNTRFGRDPANEDPDSAARHDRRQQAAVGRVGAGQGAAGRLPGASAARAYCAAATAKQPRGARSAFEGARTTPPRCRGLRQRSGRS